MARDEQIKLSLVDGVTKSLGQIRDGVSGVGAQITKLNQAAELASKGFGLIGSAVSAIGSNVQGVADLESTLAVIQERTQATAAEMGLLQQAISAATRDGKASIEDAAAALAELTKEGLSATQSAQALGPVLAFAASNATNASQAVGSLLDILGGFNAPADGIASLADKLTALSRATGAPVESLQKGLAGISVQADAANLSLDQSLVLIGALANRSIEGGRASAALTKALAELTDPASKAGEALKEVGGNTADVMQALRLLAADAGKAEAVLSQFGENPRLALQALLADGGAALDGLQQKLDEATGSSQAASDAIGNTFNRAVVALQNSVANLRNEFLAPILGPLADEAQAVAEKLNALSDSPQFAKLRDQFAELATGAIRSIGELIEKADLEIWAANISEFGADAAEAFRGLMTVIDATSSTVRAVGAAIEYLAKKGAEFDALFGEADKSLNGFNAAAQDTSRSLSHLGPKLDANKKSTRELGDAANAGAGNVRVFAVEVDRAAEDLRQIPPAAKLSVKAINELAAAAASVSIAGLESQLHGLVRAQADLANSGVTSGAEFQRLTQQIGQTEQEIQRLKDSSKGAGDANKDLAGSADTAGNSLKGFSNAAAGASNAADDLKSSNSQVSDSFGNIGQAAAAAQADLGNMSKKLIDLAIQMQSQARSGRDVIDVWESINRQYQESEKRVQDRIALLERQNAAMDEEAQIRRRLIAMYGDDTTSIERLVQLELQRTQAVRERADLAEREAATIERQQAAIAGGFGAQQTQQEQAPAATGGRGSAAGGGRSAPQIVINVQGMTTDQARAFVEQSVVPELERINRLSR